MHIQITKKMHKLLDVPLTTADEGAPFCWHMNYQIMGGKKLYFLTEDTTRFGLVFFNIKKRDLKTLPTLITKSFKLYFNALNMPSDLIDEFLFSLGEVTYGKTKNSQQTSRQTQAFFLLDGYMYDKGANFDDPFQLHASDYINTTIFSFEKVYIEPYEAFFKLIKEWYFTLSEDTQKNLTA